MSVYIKAELSSVSRQACNRLSKSSVEDNFMCFCVCSEPSAILKWTVSPYLLLNALHIKANTEAEHLLQTMH